MPCRHTHNIFEDENVLKLRLVYHFYATKRTSLVDSDKEKKVRFNCRIDVLYTHDCDMHKEISVLIMCSVYKFIRKVKRNYVDQKQYKSSQFRGKRLLQPFPIFCIEHVIGSHITYSKQNMLLLCNHYKILCKVNKSLKMSE